MRTLSVLRTQAFRIVVVYLALFAVSIIALVGFVYWNTTLALDRQTDETIDAEVTGLVEQYQRLGLPGLSDVIVGRSVRGGQGLYLLAGASQRVIAGNLDTWPQIEPSDNQFVEFPYERRIGNTSELRHARGKIFALAQGFYLLVARDVHDRRQLEEMFGTMLPWSVIMMIILGLLGGVVISRNFLARLDVINRTSRQIIAGDLSQRVPVSRAGDELDDLASQLNRMLARIEGLLRGIREVSDNVAHDLRSPLNRLRSRLELASMREGTDSEIGKDIEAAVQETDRLIGTFNSLLLIAEAEAGSVRETMEELDLRDTIEGVGELYGPVADEKNLRLTVRMDSGATIARGNRNLLSQALANLVDNAIKYTPAGGLISIALENRDGGPAIVVSDTGPGIPADDRARVLERFVRLESSRNSPGTGLGLSLVVAVAHMHEADFVLEDNAPGLRAVLQLRRPPMAKAGKATKAGARRAEMAH